MLGLILWASVPADAGAQGVIGVDARDAGDGPGSGPQNGVLSPLAFGARCDGRSDDAPAINRALDRLRAQHSVGDMTPLTGLLRLPARQCRIESSLNATGLASAAVMIEGTGGSLLCETRGEPCIDAMNSARLAFRDITIVGDPAAMPSIGLQVGRPSRDGSAAGMYLDHVTISGSFSLAAFYNLNAETQLAVKLNASNDAQGGFGAIYDGLDHFNARSAFAKLALEQDRMESFNDNSCINCRITSSGVGGVPVWIGGTNELTFENSYISNFNAGVGAILYSWNTNLNFDAHFEATRLTSVFLLSGQTHPTLYGLRYREHDFFGQRSMFALDRNVRVATLTNVEIDIGRVHGHGTWFDDPDNYTVSGRVSGVTAAGWVMPKGGFSGTACFAATCTTQ